MPDIDPFHNWMDQWILSHGLPQRMASLALRPGKLQYRMIHVTTLVTMLGIPYGNGRQQSWYCMLNNDHASLICVLSLSVLTPML